MNKNATLTMKDPVLTDPVSELLMLTNPGS